MKAKRLAIVGISATVLAIVGIVLFLGSPAHISGATVELLHIKQLGGALFDYAKQHNNAFPPSIAELPTDGILADVRHFCDPQTKKLAEWIYYPGYTLHSPPTTIIAASPSFAGTTHQRIALYADGSARLLSEAVFQQQLLLQGHSQ